MVDLLPRLKSKGIEVDLCVFDGERTAFRHEIESAGIKVFDFGVGNHVYNPLNILRLRKLMRRYDIVHTHNTAPQFFAAIAKVLCSVVLCTTEHTTSNRRRGWKWCRPIDRWMYNRYIQVICISQKAEDNLRVHIGNCKADICTVNNGVDIAKYKDATASPELERIEPNSKKIIMVAGFRWEKDQDTIIRSLRLLPDEFHLFLVGDGVRRQELENLATQCNVSPRVHFLGLRNDIPQLLHAADYVVMSSHFEGLSLSSIEGMSVGKAFIASDVQGLREVTEDAGLLFPHQDEKALSDCILSLSKDSGLYKKVAERCFERASMYDIDKMVNGYSEIYQQLKKSTR